MRVDVEASLRLEDPDRLRGLCGGGGLYYRLAYDHDWSYVSAVLEGAPGFSRRLTFATHARHVKEGLQSLILDLHHLPLLESASNQNKQFDRFESSLYGLKLGTTWAIRCLEKTVTYPRHNPLLYPALECCQQPIWRHMSKKPYLGKAWHHRPSSTYFWTWRTEWAAYDLICVTLTPGGSHGVTLFYMVRRTKA